MCGLTKRSGWRTAKNMWNCRTMLVARINMRSIVYYKRTSIWKRNRRRNNGRRRKRLLKAPSGRIKIGRNRIGYMNGNGWIRRLGRNSRVGNGKGLRRTCIYAAMSRLGEVHRLGHKNASLEGHENKNKIGSISPRSVVDDLRSGSGAHNLSDLAV